MQTMEKGVFMINFIVVDDVKEITKKVENIINKIMMNNKLEYKTHIFYDYNNEFKELVDKPLTNKIYFLDIETQSASGIDIARLIRKNDLDSVIIFITAHEELGSTIIKEQLMVLTFICKFDNFDIKVKDAIMKSLSYIGKKRIIKFTDNNAVYIIPIKDILYITHDNVERKCLIKTANRIYKVGKTLAELSEMANGALVYSHRACLVNEERIVKVDKKNKSILFDNGDRINLVSDNYKKEVSQKC